MKRILCLIIFLHTQMGVNYAQIIIPDANFAAAIRSVCPTCIDGSNILLPPAQSLSTLNVSSKNIVSLTGLNGFVNLKELNCSFNQIPLMPSLPVGLLRLYCWNNQLISLPTLPLTLYELNCSNNFLTSLPTIPNGMLYVTFQGNQIVSFAPMPNSVVNIDCRRNLITALTPLPPNLVALYCGDNQISVLPTLPNTLTSLYCFNNRLPTLPTLPTNLTVLLCDNNMLTNLPSLPNGLLNLNCRSNQLTDLPTLPNGLTELYCDNNNITTLPTLPNSLQKMYCGTNKLTALPTLPNSLTNFSCEWNKITAIPNIPSAIIDFNCYENLITTIPALPSGIKSLVCYSNQLTSLPNMPASLTKLSCGHNNLTTIPSSLAYTELRCDYNNIQCLPTLGSSLTTLWVPNSVTCLPNIPASLTDFRKYTGTYGTGVYTSTMLPVCYGGTCSSTPQVCGFDNSFGTEGKVITNINNMDCYGTNLITLSNNKIVVIGSIGTYPNINTDVFILRYHVDGSLDNSFGTNGITITDFQSSGDYLMNLAVQADGKIIAVGGTNTTGDSLLALVRYNSNGTLDNTFGTNGKQLYQLGTGTRTQGNAIHLLSNGQFYIAGYATDINKIRHVLIARFNNDGSVDPTWGNNGRIFTDLGFREVCWDFKVLSDGKFLVTGGYSTDNSPIAKILTTKYNADGTLDNNFGTNGKVLETYRGDTRSIAIQTDGKIVIAGHTRVDDITQNNSIVIRYNANGTRDNTFGINGVTITDFNNLNEITYGLALQPDGKILTSSYYYPSAGTIVSRYNTNGDLDATFGTSGKINFANLSLPNMTLQANGRIVLTGSGWGDGMRNVGVARINAICTILSAELLSFKGKNTEGGNLLSWQTANEVNTSHFDIEHSNDGIKFEKIGLAKAKGFNSSYEFLDNKTSSRFETSTTLGTLTNYYRLTINDLDGKTTVSKIISIEKNSDKSIKISRNTEGSILIETNAQIELITITNTIGQLIKSTKEKQFLMSELNSGIYIISVKTDKGFLSQKIFKN